MNYGFVYILTNDAMPKMFKVGCTERSPHQRAGELSSGTAVPLQFTVMCYAEFMDFQSVERKLHAWLADARVSDNREFFYRDDMDGTDSSFQNAVAYLYHHPSRLAFTSTNDLLGELGPQGFGSLMDPWLEQEENEKSNVIELAQVSRGSAA